MKTQIRLFVMELGFVISGMLFIAGLVSVSAIARAGSITEIAKFCGTPAAGTTTCPNAPPCVSGLCTNGVRGCDCQ